ncbi:Activating signal cointegrator 1 complex subunit 3, related [Eimeria praecox]|uniref:Activating signal cointegrator 1 complex subunit 3, related n=1 Tax=Eimeria praecox TaxID=51316 RepID=U6H5M8_9EIME|nr:Activating signal cointegrator 1 complex subunit 3, related [Eimeria praecox]
MAAMNKPTFDAILTHAVTERSRGSAVSEDGGVYSISSSSSSSSSSASSSASSAAAAADGGGGGGGGAPAAGGGAAAAAAAAATAAATTQLKPVLVFVASRRQTRLTARELIALQHMHDGDISFLCLETKQQQTEFAKAIKQVKDSSLRSVLVHGVGLHHAGLSSSDRNISAYLFSIGVIRVLVASATLAWGLNLPARLVVIKGTEYFDGKTKRYTDMPVTDILQVVRVVLNMIDRQ